MSYRAQLQARIDAFRAATMGLGVPPFAAKQAETAADVGELYLYDAIGDYWSGLTAKQVVTALDELKAKGAKTLCVYINSPGGDVFEAAAIYNNLKRFDGQKTVMIDGLAASAASVIAMVGDEILMPTNAMMMIHDPWGFAIGNSVDMRKVADDLDQVRDVIVNTYATRTGCAVDDLKAMMTAETWLTAEQALAKGFCDTVLADEPDAEAPQDALANPILAKFKKTPAALKARSATPHARLAAMRKRHDSLTARASPSSTKRAGPPATSK